MNSKWLLFLLFLLLPSSVWAASGDSLNPTTVTTGTGWTNWVVDSINTSDNKRGVYSGTGQAWAKATGFGISITPTGTVVVDSIKCMIEGNGTSATLSRRRYNVQLLKADAAAGTIYLDTLDQTTDRRDWDNTDAVLWGTTWTEADLESTTFGVQIQDADGTLASALNFDHVMLRVWWRDVTAKPMVITVEDN